MLVEWVGGGGTRILAGYNRPRRGPRPEEIALMRLLAAGPKPMTSGPIGRCVKRGWCRAWMAEEADGPQRHTVVLFLLTDAGRALIAEG